MSKPKILIVDDSQLNREILSCMLEDKYDICEAENGKQAVEILERCHKDFKLVLLDLIMPVMDGYQVLAVICANGHEDWFRALVTRSAYFIKEYIKSLTWETSQPQPVQSRAAAVAAVHRRPLTVRQ